MKGTSVKIKSRVAPRDVTDVLLFFVVLGPLQVVIVLILPSVIAYLLTDSVIWAIATYMVIYFIACAFVVWSVRLSESGIHFRRLLGSPRFLAWEAVTDIAEAPRREVVIQGWLWPLFPPRETTLCLSALGHFRIRWQNGWCYFAPRDAEAFQRLVDEFRGQRRGCVKCGYDLRAHASGQKCPECGTMFPVEVAAAKTEGRQT